MLYCNNESKVRELKKRASLEETTARELREMLSTVADEFVRPEAPTEVNVKGSTRNHVLVAIQAALEAGKGKTGGNIGEARRERVLALTATVALVDLAREIHALIFDGLWPRFLVSSEFTLLMNTEVCVCLCLWMCLVDITLLYYNSSTGTR